MERFIATDLQNSRRSTLPLSYSLTRSAPSATHGSDALRRGPADEQPDGNDGARSARSCGLCKFSESPCSMIRPWMIAYGDFVAQ